MKERRDRKDLGLVLVWLSIGIILRLTNLTAKPLWTDEFSTLVFSLGHSFQSIPLNQPIAIGTLLQPLRPDPQMGVAAVWTQLFAESNHPPLFFVLMHGWLRLFLPDANGWTSAWAVRSLPAVFGVATIPATFGLGWLAFRSRLVGHIAAALMAVSPFSIYLAQEARHYTLPLLWVIASLACFVVAVQSLDDDPSGGTASHRISLPLWICGVWIVVNALGIATHYFFVFTLIAEGLVLAGLGIWLGVFQRSSSSFLRVMPQVGRSAAGNDPVLTAPPLYKNYWNRIGCVAIGTLLSGLVWLPLLQSTQDSELTRWIYRGASSWGEQQSYRAGLALLEPLTQAIGGWISMLYLLPIQAETVGLQIGSAVGLLLITVWTVPKLIPGLRVQWQSEHRLMVLSLGGVVLGAIALFLGITYLLGMDVTSAFRYNFVYFPAAMVLIAAALARTTSRNPLGLVQNVGLVPLFPQFWRESARKFPNLGGLRGQMCQSYLHQTKGTRTILVIGLLSLLGGLTVVTNLGFQKTHRPDLVVQAIRKNSDSSTLVAIAHRTHGQTGRLMGIAWEWQRTADPTAATSERTDPQFLLAHQDENPRSPIIALRRSLNSLPRPLDLWLVNFKTVPERPLRSLLQQQDCVATSKRRSVDGYQYELHRCQVK